MPVERHGGQVLARPREVERRGAMQPARSSSTSAQIIRS
jgi:hypothetical protein